MSASACSHELRTARGHFLPRSRLPGSDALPAYLPEFTSRDDQGAEVAVVMLLWINGIGENDIFIFQTRRDDTPDFIDNL